MLLTLRYSTPKLIDANVEQALAVLIQSPPWYGKPTSEGYDSAKNTRWRTWEDVQKEDFSKTSLYPDVGLTFNRAGIMEWQMEMRRE